MNRWGAQRLVWAISATVLAGIVAMIEIRFAGVVSEDPQLDERAASSTSNPSGAARDSIALTRSYG